MEALRKHVAEVVATNHPVPVSFRVQELCMSLYEIIKTRGYKTIVSFFPHQISDLNLVIQYIGIIREIPRIWAVRYVILLWLSLICRLPFDLKSFDEDNAVDGETAHKVESIGREYIDKTGLERNAAALVLARLYSRKDTQVLLGPFISWCREQVLQSTEVFQVLGAMQVFSELLKSGGIDQIGPHMPDILELAQRAPHNSTLASSTFIRKFAIKITGRVGLKQLPALPVLRISAKTLHGHTAPLNESYATHDEEDLPDISPELEGIVDDLLGALKDRDTAIRWSGAKYIARIGARVPEDFSNQLLDAILDVYDIFSVEGEDLTPAAEPSWHGATLACAEFARQGLIHTSRISNVVNRVSKALFFDVRKGASSIGSNVRDSACYFFWSLARMQEVDTIKPFSTSIAQSLITLALFDKEVHIRLAASAAFQENVGRMGLFPHGIDLLKWTDIYGVGLRRNAFLVAAPQVSQYVIYRQSLLDHLLGITLKHWDPAMRSSGSQSLREICKYDMPSLAPNVIARLQDSLVFVDNSEIHGAIFGLKEMAEGSHAVEDPSVSLKRRVEIFQLLDKLSETTIKGYGNDILLQAACLLMSSSITKEGLESRPDSGVERTPRWRLILDFSLKHGNDVVQQAAAEVVGHLSDIRSCDGYIDEFIAELKTTNPDTQQGMTRVLGYTLSTSHAQGLRKVIECLLGIVKKDNSKQAQFRYCVEARRNAYDSLSRILQRIKPKLFTDMQPEVFISIVQSFLNGLEDYTIDQRGDVGSWVRIACIKGVSSCTQLIMTAPLNTAQNWLPNELRSQTWAGLLKQGAERLDNVRAEVGRQLRQLLKEVQVKELQKDTAGLWTPDGFSLLKELFLFDDDNNSEWHESNWLFPRIVQLLQIPSYQEPILRGIILSIGSRNETTHRPAANALTEYLPKKETEAPEEQITEKVLAILLQLAKKNSTSNAIVIPVLSTFEVLIEAGIAAGVSSQEGIKILESLVSFVGERVERLKNVQRINLSMKIIIQLLAVPTVFEKAKQYVSSFLGHAFPKVREETSEYIYLVIQSQDIPGGEEAEPFLLETDWTGSEYQDSVGKVVAALNGD